jgi:hypothetical protein
MVGNVQFGTVTLSWIFDLMQAECCAHAGSEFDGHNGGWDARRDQTLSEFGMKRCPLGHGPYLDS